jgi:LAO/AO transport system kinase
VTDTTVAERGARLAEAALAGDRRALARLLTEVEERTGAGEVAVRLLHPRAGAAHLVGVTGPPGAGKSTLVAALVTSARAAGRTVSVVAVDPSSPITGGAILGDRVRMQRHAGDEGVFIRSVASRGHAGGLAASTAAAAAVLDACGFDLVLVETVGTGQGEVEVATIADTTVVVQAPEMGDEVQAIKAGLLEVADVVAVTKGDRPGADRAAAQLRAMLAAGASHGPSVAARPRPKRPEVLLVSGLTGQGVADLLAALDRRRPASEVSPAVAAAADGADDPGAVPDGPRRRRAEAQVTGILAERLRARLHEPGLGALSDETVAAVARHDLDPYAAADRLLDAILRSGRA